MPRFCSHRFVAIAFLICAPLFAEDPYEQQIVFDFGPNDGKEADLGSRRSIVKLPPEEAAAKYGAGEGDTVVANFFHEGKFWVAKIPKDGVEDLIFQVWKFNKIPPLSHDQLRFKMKPGKEVTLYPQDPSDTSLTQKLSDFVFSMEAVYPKGGAEFGVKTGTNGSFLSAYRFKSQKEDYFERVLSAKLKVRQLRMNLSPEQQEQALRDALQLSHDSQMNVRYHLTRKSCTTVAYEILDGVADYGPMRKLFALVNWLPNWPEWHLYWRGLLPRDGKPIRLPTVNEEFTDYSKDRGLKRRLVEMLRETKDARNEARAARRAAPKGFLGHCGALLSRLRFW